MALEQIQMSFRHNHAKMKIIRWITMFKKWIFLIIIVKLHEQNRGISMKNVAIKIQPYQQDVVQKVQHSSAFRCHPCISQCSDFIERPLKDHLNLSSFTHPNVFPNLYGFLCSVEHKIKFEFEERLGYKTTLDPNDFYYIFINQPINQPVLIKVWNNTIAYINIFDWTIPLIFKIWY